MNESIKDFKDRVIKAQAKPEDGVLFWRIFCESFHQLGLTVADVVDKCDASRPTIALWVSGRCTPTPTVRKALYEWFLEKME